MSNTQCIFLNLFKIAIDVRVEEGLMGKKTYTNYSNMQKKKNLFFQ